MATSATARQINQRRILQTLFLRGPMTRAQLARELAMTKSGLSNVIEELIGDRLLLERPEPASRPVRVGRPGTSLELDAAGACFLGAEVRPGRVSTTLVDMKCQVVGVPGETHAVDTADPTRVVELLGGIVDRFAADGTWTPLSGVCLVIPGFVSRLGTAHVAGLGWHEVQIQDVLRHRFGRNTTIENDANAAAFAEWYGSPPNERHDLLMLALSTGAGAGLVSDGRIVRGYNGMAGEIGHIVLSEQASGAFDAQPLTWEQAIGSNALRDAYSRRIDAPATLADFVQAVGAGDAIPVGLAETWARWTARGLLALIYAHDPERIVVSGELAPLFHLMKGVVEAHIRDRLASGFPLPTITTSALGGHIASLGGAAIMHSAWLREAVGNYDHNVD